MKTGQADVRVQEAKFVYGNVCIGLALINEFKNRTPNAKTNGDGEPVSISEVVATTTRAVGPFLVPMIDYLGALTVDEVSQLAQVGDEL